MDMSRSLSEMELPFDLKRDGRIVLHVLRDLLESVTRFAVQLEAVEREVNDRQITRRRARVARVGSSTGIGRGRAKRGRPRKDENRAPKPVKSKVVTTAPVQKSAYETAKDIVRGLRLKSRAEFTAMSKDGKRPEGVPARPDLTFAGGEWEGWAAFLGNAPAENKTEERELVTA
jgi:hypothetical protein